MLVNGHNCRTIRLFYKKQNKTYSKGFSLIELIVIIMVLGILAAVASTRMKDVTGGVSVSVAINQITSDLDLIKEISKTHVCNLCIQIDKPMELKYFKHPSGNKYLDKRIVEMLIPSTLDNSLAPEGKHVASLFCQQFSPKLQNGKSWHDYRLEAAETIINTVTEHAPNFKDSIIGSMILSPLDLEEKFGLIGGDIMHGNMTLDQMWAARPLLNYGNYRGPIKSLYMLSLIHI